MSITIYETTPSGLYATGDRTVSTFPSGLIRVDQTFVCKNSAAATHRAALAVGTDMPGGSAPAIDGLKIFPKPQEKRRDDGFTEFIVSAYGRLSENVIDEVAASIYTNPANKFTSERSLLTRRYIVPKGGLYSRPITIPASFLTYYSENPLAKLTINGTSSSGSFRSPNVADSWLFFYFSFTGNNADIVFKDLGNNTIASVDSAQGSTTVLISLSGLIDPDLVVGGVTFNVTNGTITNVKVEKFATLPPPVNIAAQWVQDGSELTNYGEFTEVILRYKSENYFI